MVIIIILRLLPTDIQSSDTLPHCPGWTLPNVSSRVETLLTEAFLGDFKFIRCVKWGHNQTMKEGRNVLPAGSHPEWNVDSWILSSLHSLLESLYPLTINITQLIYIYFPSCFPLIWNVLWFSHLILHDLHMHMHRLRLPCVCQVRQPGVTCDTTSQSEAVTGPAWPMRGQCHVSSREVWHTGRAEPMGSSWLGANTHVYTATARPGSLERAGDQTEMESND